ncbi:MAG: hypothetical protein U9R44_02625 [Candidatus Omnitrophota bacterium]|nr:hypothetical protein [Candidatus Omnitrophota bacterium]
MGIEYWARLFAMGIEYRVNRNIFRGHALASKMGAYNRRVPGTSGKLNRRLQQACPQNFSNARKALTTSVPPELLKIFFVIFLFLTTISPATGFGDSERGPFDITAKVDRNRINVGDRIKLGIIAEETGGLEVYFPETPEDLGEFTLVGSSPVEKGRGKGRKVGREYIMSIYTTGTHVIPPVKVSYRQHGETQWQVVDSPQVPIDVVSLLTGEDKDIKDIKGLLVSGMRLFLLVIILVLLLMAGAVSWALWHRKIVQAASEAAVERTAHEIAYEQLRQLKAMDLPGKGRIKEYYTRLSDIIRHYLENRFSLRAPEMTTEEFMEKLKRSPALIDEHKGLLKDFLSNCDLVKFAKYGPSPLEILDSFQAAERLVDKTRPEEEEEDVELKEARG